MGTYNSTYSLIVNLGSAVWDQNKSQEYVKHKNLTGT